MWLLHILPPQMFMIASFGAMLLAPAFIGKQVGGFYGLLLGILVGAVLVRHTFKHFLVFTPKKEAILVMNPLLSEKNGEARIRTVLSGLSAKYPWEQASPNGLFPLENIRVPFDVECPSKDGPSIKVTGAFTYTPDPKRLLAYYISRNIVREMVLDKVRSFISASVATKNAVTVRNTMKDLGEKVTHYFSVGDNATPEEQEGTDVVTKLEENFGITFNRLTVADVVFADKYQNARTSKAVMETLANVAKKLQEETGVSGQDAVATALIVNGEVKKTVHENISRIEGSGADAALAALQSIFAGKGERSAP